MQPLNSSWLPVAAAALAILAAAWFWRKSGGRGGSGIGLGLVSGSDFEIRHRPAGPGLTSETTVRGQVPASKIGALRAFFERDLNLSGPVTVRGHWSPAPARVLRLEIAGGVNPGQRQQIRNFLTVLLR